MEFEHPHQSFAFSLLSKDQKKPTPELEHAQRSSHQQRSVILDLATKSYQSLWHSITRSEAPQKHSVSKYDQKIVGHLAKHGGWTQTAEKEWLSSGGNLEAARSRTHALRKLKLIDRSYKATDRYKQLLTQAHTQEQERNLRRLNIVRQQHREKTLGFSKDLTKHQLATLQTLAEFRQMTPHQAVKLGCPSHELKHLEELKLVHSQNLICDQKHLKIITLTESKRLGDISGKDIARHRLGIKDPFVGILKDQSKLVHDLSVVDSLICTRDKFTKKGYEFIHAISEHRLYQEKTDASSDVGQKYADAYMIFQNSDGDTLNVAVEFGNYRPSYLKEKLAGIDADQIMVYTHDEQRAEGYTQVITDFKTPTEVNVIPPPYEKELDR